MGRLLIHIGYHKTGSSWLQKFLFGNSSSAFRTIADKKLTVSNALIRPRPLHFDVEVCKSVFLPRLHEIQTQSPLMPVLSSEDLCGSPHSGGYEGREIAERLKQVFDQAKILIVLREQRSIVLSTYLSYVGAGGACSLEDYLAPPWRPFRLPHFDWNHFAYDRTIALYRRLFGEENVLVLPYELFQASPAEFVGYICQFCGMPAISNLPLNQRTNVSPPILSHLLRRRINPFLVRDPVNGFSPLALPHKVAELFRFVLRQVGCFTPKSVEARLKANLVRRIENLVEQRYVRSNETTASLIGLDLDKFGYQVSAEWTFPSAVCGVPSPSREAWKTENYGLR